MSRHLKKMRLREAAAICVTAAFLIAPGSVAAAQEPVSMFCKTSALGPGFVLVTLTNIALSSIPKGQTLFAKKGGKTIQFKAGEAIPPGGSATQRTSEADFQVEGNCDGWR